MPDSPDQHLIDALARELGATPSPNGHKVEPSTAPSLLSDGQILELCRKAKNAAKFASLYDDGDIAGYPSPSEADYALLGILKFYTQDPDQLEQLWFGSALGQSNKVRTRADYRRRTINEALEGVTETYQRSNKEELRAGNPQPQVDVPSDSHSLGSTGMRNEEDKNLKRSIQAISFRGREKPGPRAWIVENTIWKGYTSMWYGEGGVAKSLLALHLAMTVATKERWSWHGFPVKTVPVLYIDFELDADEQHRRALHLCAGMKLEDVPEEFHYLNAAGLPPTEAFGVAAEECKRLGAELAIVDSVGFALEGDSETAADVLGFYRNCLQPLNEVGATPHLLDHQAKIIKGEKYADKQAFGSVYKTNAVRSSFQVRGSWEENVVTATFTHKKNNFGRKESDFSLKVAFEGDVVTIERLSQALPNPDRQPTIKERVLKAVEELGRATAETVANKTGIEKKTVQNAFTDLLKEDALKDTGEKQNKNRIVIPHSRTTKGTGTGITAQGVANPVSFDLKSGESATVAELRARRDGDPLVQTDTDKTRFFKGENDKHPSSCLCEECVPE
jgi:hypothetical protein